MKTKERKKMRRRWILLGILLAAVVAVGSFAMGETPERPVSAGERGAPYAANGSAEAGAFTLTGDNLISDTDYTYDATNGMLTLQTLKAVTIENTDKEQETTDGILISDMGDGQTVNLILAGVKINTSGVSNKAAMQIADDAQCHVNITLNEGTTNSLQSGNNCAGLQKNGDTSTGTLTIQGGSSGTGRLNATGGERAAGIGGGQGGTGSNITIEGGDVTATGGANGGAGIGGGDRGSGSNITIRGGNVTAAGKSGGAGIGGGRGESGSGIEITGGRVTATGGTQGGSGIGGGDRGSGSNIQITGGNVIATGIWGSGIGGGRGESGSEIIIGGTCMIEATGRGGGAGIGGGSGGNGSNIEISGGTVTATGGGAGSGAAGIGGGYGGTGSTGNSLSGDAVVLTSSSDDTKPALEGFDGGLTKGIAFVTQGAPAADNKYAGTVYGEIVTGHLPGGSLSFPENTATLTISAGNNAFTIDNGKTLSIPSGVTLINQQTLTNQGTIENEGTIDNQGMMITESENITCGIAGTVTTKVGYVEDLSNAIPDRDILYLDNAGEVKTYIGEDLPMPEKIAGYTFQNWCSDFGRMQEIIADTTPVQLNTHILYAKWEANEYTITVQQPTGGAIKIIDKAKTGDTVIFTAVPDSGYRIKGLPQVNTTNEMANGSINVTPTGNENEYQFTMEDSDVTVTAEFELAPQPGPTPEPLVDPGSDGSGSAKTGDPFAGGIALALLGTAAAAGIALKKRK